MTSLHEIARRSGVQTSYRDLGGRRVPATRRALERTLEALGPPPGRGVEPVRVAWEGRLRLRGKFTIRLEGGGKVHGAGRRLPYGYHRLQSRRGETLILSAPLRAHVHPGRTWGAFLPTYALHSRRNPAAGDFGDLESLIEWVTRLGGSHVATLPLLSMFPDDYSPYRPVSRLFWNDFYLDAGGGGERGTLVDYPKEMARRRRRLERRVPRRLSADALLRDYARFRAAREKRDSERYHISVQLQAREEMRRLRPSLYLDFPLGVHPDGYDVWRWRELFAEGVATGAPPDHFFVDGQNWGCPPLHPWRNREEGYRYVIETIRHHMQASSILRFDHVVNDHIN